MSARPPRFDTDALQSALGGARPAATYDRTGRIKLCGEFAEAVIAGRESSRESLLFVAGAISAWLANGGSLERDYLQVIVNGSHATPDRVWQAMKSPSFERMKSCEGVDTIRSSSTKTRGRK